MKFHCDRCKTKYSISDDRVRGKILKIRCKNCSAVITVREEGAAAAKPAAAKPAAAAKAAAVSAPASAETTGARAQQAGQKALAGAFKQSVTQAEADPGRSGSSAPPVSLEAEWYLSKDGEQEGPFSLQEARVWVQNKAEDDELHCWSEGYDDWLPTDKVSHFRSLRRPPSHPADDELPTLADDQPEVTPKPLFAATMQAVESQVQGASGADEIIPSSITPGPKAASTPAPTNATGPFDSIPQAGVQKGSGGQASAPSNGAKAPPIPMAAKGAASFTPAPEDDGGSLEFDIGEASRVVDLPSLLAARGNAPVRPKGPMHKSDDGLPGMGGGQPGLGRGSGQEAAVGGGQAAPGGVGYRTGPAMALGGQPGTTGSAMALDAVALEEAAMPAKHKKRRGLHIPLIVTALLIGGVAVAMILLLTGDDDSSHVARGTVGGSGNLGYSFSGDTRRPKNPGESQEVVPENPTTNTTKNGGRIRKNPNVKTNPKNTGGTLKPIPVRDPDEVDLGSGTTQVATGPLDGDDLMKVYRKNQIAIKMCYERELKKNPLLKLPKTWVDIQVGLDGRVSGVSIPSLQGTPLGNCMRSRIARWKFRKTTETFSSRFPVVFGS